MGRRLEACMHDSSHVAHAPVNLYGVAWRWRRALANTNVEIRQAAGRGDEIVRVRVCQHWPRLRSTQQHSAGCQQLPAAAVVEVVLLLLLLGCLCIAAGSCSSSSNGASCPPADGHCALHRRRRRRRWPCCLAACAAAAAPGGVRCFGLHVGRVCWSRRLGSCAVPQHQLYAQAAAYHAHTHIGE